MVDEWSGLADMLANLIEKYASVLDIDSLPDITVDNHVENEIVRDMMKADWYEFQRQGLWYLNLLSKRFKGNVSML